MSGGSANIAVNDYTTISGGQNNTNQAVNASIGGGTQNQVQTGANASAIGGGAVNIIESGALQSTIAGGWKNVIGPNALRAAIGGGNDNQATNSYATVPGGQGNLAGGQWSLAAGRNAQALHQGAFVWADSQTGNFPSTANDQFLIRAQGGVGINTNNPSGSTLNVNGTVTAGVFQGNGALPWQVVSGASAAIPADTGYFFTNAASQNTITLPTSPKVGDIVRIASSSGWKIVQGSGQSILIESLGLSQWRETIVNVITNFIDVAISADGTKLFAVSGDSWIYISTNSGATWTPDTGSPATNWSAIACSSDGTKIVAAVNGGQIYTSEDSGSTWFPSAGAPSTNWQALASSSDRIELLAASETAIYRSSNSGKTWSQLTTDLPADEGSDSLASSADGGTLAAAINRDVYISSDSGSSWHQLNNFPFAEQV
ncbi:MAG: hypothetical protein ACRED1_04470, partial [Limisphaerales bacterium]